MQISQSKNMLKGANNVLKNTAVGANNSPKNMQNGAINALKNISVGANN